MFYIFAKSKNNQKRFHNGIFDGKQNRWQTFGFLPLAFESKLEAEQEAKRLIQSFPECVLTVFPESKERILSQSIEQKI